MNYGKAKSQEILQGKRNDDKREIHGNKERLCDSLGHGNLSREIDSLQECLPQDQNGV